MSKTTCEYCMRNINLEDPQTDLQKMRMHKKELLFCSKYCRDEYFTAMNES
jgi:hypothetical protein